MIQDSPFQKMFAHVSEPEHKTGRRHRKLRSWDDLDKSVLRLLKGLGWELDDNPESGSVWTGAKESQETERVFYDIRKNLMFLKMLIAITRQKSGQRYDARDDAVHIAVELYNQYANVSSKPAILKFIRTFLDTARVGSKASAELSRKIALDRDSGKFRYSKLEKYTIPSDKIVARSLSSE